MKIHPTHPPADLPRTGDPVSGKTSGETQGTRDWAAHVAGSPGQRISAQLQQAFHKTQSGASPDARHPSGRTAGASTPVNSRPLSFCAFRFEPGKGPKPEMAYPSLRRLAMVESDISSGASGSVSIFANPRGDRFIGKRIKPEVVARRKERLEKKAAPDANRRGHRIGDLLEHEWAAFRKIQEEAGPHPNLVQAYGIGRFEDGEEPILLMDYVPGMSGTDAFKALRRCLDTRRISYAEYTEAIKFVINGLLNAVGHMGKAGVVHLDIKPDNFIVHEATGEPKVIDPGLWAATDERASSGTKAYAAPEVFDPRGRVSERSDVFSVAANLVHAWEGYGVIEHKDGRRRAADGLRKDRRVLKDARGNAVRQPGIHASETAYTRFLASTLHKTRPDSAQAQALEYLSDRMLDDDAAKAVLKKVMTIAREEAQKPQGEQWKFRAIEKPVSDERFNETQRMLVELHRHPRWETYASLIHCSRTDPELKNYFEAGGAGPLQASLEKGAARHAQRLIERSGSWAKAAGTVARGWSWSKAADNAARFAARMWRSKTAIQSGVDTNGVRLKAPGRGVAGRGAAGSGIQAARQNRVQQRMSPHVALDELRAYAAEAEVFLLDVKTLEPITDPALKAGVERIRQLAQDARQVLALSGPGGRTPEPT